MIQADITPKMIEQANKNLSKILNPKIEIDYKEQSNKILEEIYEN